MTYTEFLQSKLQFKGDTGFEDTLPDFLFPFQKFLVVWALKRGRAAEFVDTGLGKTPMVFCSHYPPPISERNAGSAAAQSRTAANLPRTLSTEAKSPP